MNAGLGSWQTTFLTVSQLGWPSRRAGALSSPHGEPVEPRGRWAPCFAPCFEMTQAPCVVRLEVDVSASRRHPVGHGGDHSARSHRPQMSMARIEDAACAGQDRGGRQAGGPLQRSAGGDRHSQHGPRDGRPPRAGTPGQRPAGLPHREGGCCGAGRSALPTRLAGGRRAGGRPVAAPAGRKFHCLPPATMGTGSMAGGAAGRRERS
jgi:hypothetical protein